MEKSHVDDVHIEGEFAGRVCPTHEEAFRMLCANALLRHDAGSALWGKGLEKFRNIIPPFLIGDNFPGIYMEFPLLGEPSLDMTVLYRSIHRGERIHAPEAGDCGGLLDWYASVCRSYPRINMGFEIDSPDRKIPLAGVHFQMFDHRELVKPFFDALSMPEYGDLYLKQEACMRQFWPLSFLGLFRGRRDAPLRICGYFGKAEKERCPRADAITGNLKKAGFTAFDHSMISQLCRLMKLAPRAVDFQMDLFPDGSLGDTFAIDIELPEKSSGNVRRSFSSGSSARLLEHLYSMEIADRRAEWIPELAFAKGIQLSSYENEKKELLALLLSPQWLKVRWVNAKPVTAKCYCLFMASVIGPAES